MGIISSFAHSGANGRLITSSTIMPMNRLASSAHTSSPLRTNSSGPGCIPYCWNAASMIAAVADVGRPSASSEPIAAGRRVGRRLRRGEAADRAVAELRLGAALGQVPLQPEGQERRDLGPACRDGPERHPESRAAQPGRQRLPELVPAEVGAAADLHRGGHGSLWMREATCSTSPRASRPTVMTTMSMPSNSAGTPKV